MKAAGVIFEHAWNSSRAVVGDLSVLTTFRNKTRLKHKKAQGSRASTTSLLGLGLVALALGGLTGPLTPRIRLETRYAFIQLHTATSKILASKGDAFRSYFSKQTYDTAISSVTRTTIPAAFDPLKTPDGASIDPINKEFSLVIPKIGVNAAVIPAVNPTKPGEYLPALLKGIAHSSLSYFPDEDGTVFLFSHSTNYDWFVGDLNAVFYLLKNLEEKDTVVLFYEGTSYTYTITGKQIVNPTAVSYMAPQAGDRKLILQTCWPPGSTTERLLIFADLVEEANLAI